jgi:CRISPR-associated endonuclease/helicase Cas3
LLTAVLKEQRSVGGSAVLLSATLPHDQRQELFNAWNRKIEKREISAIPPYPLISQLTTQSFKQYCVAPEQMPPEKKVWIEPLISEECTPTAELVQQIIMAAKSGAKVAVICNLVDAAHKLFNEIGKDSTLQVMLFHSRFTLCDRQQIEGSLLNFFGPESTSAGGRILIATQVVEQSLDVDFDWMITQLCPVDLLFQRLGRLHRHAQKDSSRPEAFAVPRCTVLLPDGLDYGLHGLIYANTRVLWRTAEKLMQLNGNPIIFPNAYRQWVEAVYQEEAWGSEPPEIEKGYEDYRDTHQTIQKSAAKLMLNSAKNISPFLDDDQHITAVTRDGQMSLTVMPFVQTSKGRLLRNRFVWDALTVVERPEAVAMNMVCVPNTWQAALDKRFQAEDGIYWLPMNADGDTWQTRMGKWELQYNPKKGLERIK